MTKSELIGAVAKKAGMTRAQATGVVDTVFGTIVGALKQGDPVRVKDFGTFKVKQRAARTGVNPATGKKIQIKASKAAGFTASKTLKAELN